MSDSAFALLPDMGEYAVYIWGSYGLATIVMGVLLLAAGKELRQAQRTLSRLQSGNQAAEDR